jgi:acyl-coenzyme A thioesterase PaaI-like protein
MRKALVAGLEDHLEFVTRNMGRLRESVPGTALPYGMAMALMRALQDVNDGQPATLFAPKRLSGGRGNRRTPAKQTSIDCAVRYLTAARLGWVRAEAARVASAGRRFIVAAGSLRFGGNRSVVLTVTDVSAAHRQEA